MRKWFWEKFSREEVLVRLASGRLPPITTTVIYTTVFGKWTPELLLMVDMIPAEQEDTTLLRSIWGRNRELSPRWLQRHWDEFIYGELLTPEEFEALPSHEDESIPYEEMPEAVQKFLESLGGGVE